MAIHDDWGDPGFAGDYPTLSAGTAPSAPGKRAKRTFNKHQHALQQLVADTVVLQRGSSTSAAPRKPPPGMRVPVGSSKQSSNDAVDHAEPEGRRKKRKRDTSGAADCKDLAAPAAGGHTSLPAASAAIAVNGIAANGIAEQAAPAPVKAKRQRNKFKAQLTEGTAVPGSAEPSAAHRVTNTQAKQPTQSSVSPTAGHRKQSTGQERPKPTHADVERRNADRIDAESGVAARSAPQGRAKPHSDVHSTPVAADDDQRCYRQRACLSRGETQTAKASKAGRLRGSQVTLFS